MEPPDSFTVKLYARVRRAVVVDQMSEHARRPSSSAGSRDRAEDAAVIGAAGLPTAATGAPAEAGRLGGAIDQILEDDEAEGQNRRHTAKRIFERPRDEDGYTIVKDYLRLSESKRS